MLKLIQLLIFGHIHKWETAGEANIYAVERPDSRPIGYLKILKCRKCGLWKQQELK